VIALALTAAAGASAATGSWERAWGKDVDASHDGTRFEVCVDAAGCKVGEPDGLGGEMNAPYGLAADSSGSVYLSDQGNERVQRFADPPPAPPLAVPPSNGFSFGKLTRNKRKGSAKLKAQVTFVPTGGSARTRSKTVKLVLG
jgi:hypothetical protein